MTTRGIISLQEREAFERDVVAVIQDDTQRVLRDGPEAMKRQIAAVRVHLHGTDTPAIVDAYRAEIATLEQRLRELGK